LLYYSAIHSIYNRTPHELIQEIIIINDKSTLVELYEPLQTYVDRNFNGLVKIHVMTERKGLVGGRLEGARKAKGDVLVGIDDALQLQSLFLSFT
jgi:polypeptide N-acetylgalactosaminyltransferase